MLPVLLEQEVVSRVDFVLLLGDGGPVKVDCVGSGVTRSHDVEVLVGGGTATPELLPLIWNKR